jgi:hypothetical protein
MEFLGLREAGLGLLRPFDLNYLMICEEWFQFQSKVAAI